MHTYVYSWIGKAISQSDGTKTTAVPWLAKWTCLGRREEGADELVSPHSPPAGVAVIGGTHIAVANGAYLLCGLLSSRFGWPLPIDWLHLGLGSLCSVIADIDHPSGWLGRQIPLLGRWFERRLGRRGWTHTLWMPLFTGLLFLPWGSTLAAAATLGYGSHLLTDSLSNPGVPLWRPGRRWCWMALTTGGTWDIAVGIVALVGDWICLVERVGSPTARALSDPLGWGAVLLLVVLLPASLLSAAIRQS